MILFLNPEPDGEPRLEHRWTSRNPVFGQFVEDLRPGEVLPLRNLVGFPLAPSELPAGTFAVQAVLHTNRNLPHSGKAPGNLYSKPVPITIGRDDSKPVTLVLDRMA